ncbi:MAG: hemerythrin domain-containing protein [Anaeromyxobacter sp.]
MTGPIFQFLAQDHARLEALLARAFRGPDVDLASFGEFREGLLRHIALEEKLLVPALTAARGGEPLPFARRLRVDHGALAALLVPTPLQSTADELRTILVPHNALEEGPGGLYEACAALLSPNDEQGLLDRMRAYPPVRVARYHDGPRACRTAAEALRVSGLQSDARPVKD